jgi:hypothetical protein
MTIRVSEKTKKKAVELYKKTDTTESFSSFIGSMVKKGIEFEEIWRIKEKEFMIQFTENSIEAEHAIGKKTGTGQK